jgi:2-oxoglutarate ferredoxin oxidoreductase subunit alpha
MPHKIFSSAEVKKDVQELDSVVIRFAGDSGDGIQITGTHFTNESAHAGNDLSTFPNYPSEIRAPAGTLAGVSGFQINFGSYAVDTPGDSADVLVAFNPAALKLCLQEVKSGGILIINKDAFTEANLKKVGYEADPCESAELLENYKVFMIQISSLTKEALKDAGLPSKEVERCKNFFVLGVVSWMYSRPIESTLSWIEHKFAHRPELATANALALRAGMAYASAAEIFSVSYVVKPAPLKRGTYRNMSGTQATAYGLIAASQKSGLPLFYGAYPITPASDILHELARHRRLGVTTFQAEDEIAAICAALGAAYAGSLAVTGTSGPGLCLKTEALGLAVSTELPLVVIDVQRAGPSTGMPTKTEQSDLLQAMFGRSGEAPLCVMSMSGPSNAFFTTYEACRIAVKYMTPVLLLSEGYITNTSEPWLIPNPAELDKFESNRVESRSALGEAFLPYSRNEQTLARPWAIPGTPGCLHRIGGLEKQDGSGAVSHDAENHERMCGLRAEKIQRISEDAAEVVVDGELEGEVLILGWGGTEGAIKEAVRQLREQGSKVSRAHLYFLNPFPANLGEVLRSFKRVLIPEVNFGQLRFLIREKFFIDPVGLNSLQGRPIKVAEIVKAVRDLGGGAVNE